MYNDRPSVVYEAAELAETYCVSLEEAERIIAQFGRNRTELDFLLAHETTKQMQRCADQKLQGDFLFSI